MTMMTAWEIKSFQRSWRDHRIGLLGLARELIAHSPNRLDQRRLGGVVLKLAAQQADVDIDDTINPGEIVAPDPFEELLAREDTSWDGGEGVEQVELARGQRDRGLAAPDLAPIRVDRQPFEGQRHEF